MNERPIGIFDSGVGGTSIWKEIQHLLPKENCIYLADSKNAPYGEKTADEIIGLSVKNTELLLENNCKIIVVACNTATTNAINYLRSAYDVPFVGIEPAIKPAALNSKSKTVGILATKGTLTSALFHSTAQNHAEGIEIVEREGKGLVELIEKGELDSEATVSLLKQFLEPMLDKGIDYLVLGCTHYPYLVPVLQRLLPEGVKIIDSGEAVARQTKAVLEKGGLLNNMALKGKHRFFTNAELSVLQRFVANITDHVQVDYLDF
ncbi:glutamate racemase [Maribacter sp. MMG018]|uniref:glutamate racemase n=1 Tax=Maribacter sp. MMG018 TaxID=2822688 RepID=UPI001B35DF48|nr:glutamate racemase [Maribacter sp. MMG018]MBQ4916006.1 glutamate racemase [Maribacter sp. MMG018]